MKQIWNGIQIAFSALGGFLGWFLGGADGFLYALIAGLAALLISNYMTLTILTDDLSTLTGDLEDLKNEEIILQKQYDQRYILNDIETYAVNNLGMVKLESNMMEYIELSNPDTITVIDPYEDSKVSGFFETLSERLKELLEFLA